MNENEVARYQNLAYQHLSCINACNQKHVNDKYWSSAFKCFNKAAELLKAELTELEKWNLLAH